VHAFHAFRTFHASPSERVGNRQPGCQLALLRVAGHRPHGDSQKKKERLMRYMPVNSSLACGVGYGTSGVVE
jgi:hypothetical protein